MRAGAAIVIALGSILGACAPAEEGVVITIRTPEGNGFEPVGQLELFLGGAQDPDAGGRRIRQVLDSLGGEDLRPVDGALDGFTIYLEGIPADVEVVAVAAFDADPIEPEDYPVALGVLPITFRPGELVSAELTLRGANSGVNRTSMRWRGPALDAPPIGHSCLKWAQTDGPEEHIVRADDFDCDGTLPIDSACSDVAQSDPNIPDDLPEQDRDLDGQSTCRFCQSPFTGNLVPCDCNDDPLQNGGAQNAFLPEVCDGIDNDCDDTTFYTDHVADFRPCLQPEPNGACKAGLMGCDERLGDNEPLDCHDATTTLMDPCGVELQATCATPDTCAVSVVDASQVFDCATELAQEGGPCGGTVTLVELIENLDPAPGFPTVPTTCTAVLWGADDLVEGWTVRLADPNNIDARVIVDQPCDQITVVVLTQSGKGGRPYGTVVVVFDTETGERFTVPVSMATLPTAACSIPPMTCASPQ